MKWIYEYINYLSRMASGPRYRNHPTEYMNRWMNEWVDESPPMAGNHYHVHANEYIYVWMNE